MMRRTAIIMMCCAFLSGLAGVSQAAQAQDPAAQRQEHEQATENTLNDLNKKMDAVAADARKAGGQAKDVVNRLYDEFKKKQVSAGKDLENMRKATNETWDKEKVKMNKAIEDLNGLYERAKAGSKEEKKSPDKAK